MGMRLITTHGPRATSVRSAVAALLVAVALLATLAVPASAAATECLVTNLDTSETLTALQPAVDAASPGHRLTVEGTCHGITTITKDLVVTGVETESSGRPTLDGDGMGSVVTVLGVAVTMEDLTVQGGVTPRSARKDGGGMTNRGADRDAARRDRARQRSASWRWDLKRRVTSP